MNFIRLQFGGLSPFFYLALGFSIYAMTITMMYFHVSTLGIIANACGIIYIYFVGQGRAIGEIFSLITCFAFLSLGLEKSYHEYIARYFIYMPIAIFGIYTWIKIQKSRNGEVEIKTLSKKGVLISLSSIFIFTLIYAIFLININYPMPLISAFSVVIQFVAYYLQVQRYKENYLFFTLANSITLALFISLYMNGQSDLSPLFMIMFTLIIGIFFYFRWSDMAKKQAKKN